MSKQVAVLGAGSWGMAVSCLLTSDNNKVTLWEFCTQTLETLIKTRSNQDCLKSFKLLDEISLTGSLNKAVSDKDVIILALPSQALRSVLKSAKEFISSHAIIINLSKGIENRSLERMSEVITGELACSYDRVATLSGPSHAEEVALKKPTTVVAASLSDQLAEKVQELFSTDNFRVYKSSDLVGVELGGSLKNIIAIASGIADGLQLGDNTKGALLTRGLAEITRLGVACGAHADTFAGLSGIGDLVTTCFSKHSRNRYVGEQIAKGEKLNNVLDDMKMIAEGVQTTRSGYELAKKYGVEMPITDEVYQVLFHGKSPSVAISELMERKLRAEIWQ